MNLRGMRWGLGLLLGLTCGGAAWACTLCDSRLQSTPTFRQEAAQPTARVILAGTIRNPRLNADGKGTSDLHIEAVLRSDPLIRDRKVIELPRYLPVSDPKDPPRFLVFCDVVKNTLDPYRGVPLKSPAAIDYLKKALPLTDKDPVGNLVFFFRYLDHPDPEVARDAFLEFARATDRDVALAAPRLDPVKLRAWLQDPKTQPGQLGLYAMLLGAAGTKADAALLRGLLDSKEDRYLDAADGILAGYQHLEPREGRKVLLSILGDPRRPATLRLAAVRTLRFLYSANPKANRAAVLEAMAVVLGQEDLADLAVEDLRRWEVWDLTDNVLALYGKKGYDAPLMQRAIIRYALCCKPTPEVNAFLARCRARDAEVVQEVEEGLKLERGR